PAEVGGNRYGWFTFIDVPGGLGVDAMSLNMAGNDGRVTELAEGNAGEGTADHTITGSIPFADVDLTDVHSVSATPAAGGYVGTFTPSVTNDTTGDGQGTLGWTFTVNDAAIEHLAQGQKLTQTYTVELSDGQGGFDTTKVTVTITGTNDAPVIATTGTTGAVVETGDIAGIDEAGLTGGLEPAFALNGTITTALTSLLTNPGDLANVLTTVAGQLGGNTAQAIAVVWDYLDDIYVSAGPNQVNVNEAFIRLGIAYAGMVKGGTLPNFADVIAKYTADGGDAGSNPDRLQSLHDNLLGNLTNAALNQRFGPSSPTANAPLLASLTAAVSAVDADLLDRPYFSGNEGSSDATVRAWDVANGFAPAASGQLMVADPDQISGHVWSGNANGTYGTFAIDASTGVWTYVLDNARAATQGLAAGAPATDSFTVTVTDAFGATDTQLVTVNITGTNDAPVVTVLPNTGGTVAGINQAGAGGGLEPAAQLANLQAIINATPTDMDAILDAVQAALGGASRATAIAHVWDNLDDNYTATGYYNTPVNELFVRLGVEYARYLKEGGAPLFNVVAKFTADDADLNSTPEHQQSLHDNLLGNLNAATLDDRFDDPLLSELQALISAVDPDLLNRPVYSGDEGAANNAFAWDAANLLNVSGGQLTASDVDGGSLTWSGSAPGAYGTFTVNADGTWNYQANTALPAVQALAQGQVATETFKATVSDGNGGVETVNVTVAITGVNDLPVISGVDTGSVVESGDITAIDEAGLSGALEPIAALNATIAGNTTITDALTSLLTNPTDLAYVLNTVATQLGGGTAQAIAVVWDYLDDIYVSAGPNQGNVNEAFTRLGLEYAALVKAGTLSAFTDVTAKF
ncbi:MAG TPA: VCBS domain-containing protein, partial [Vicinamibacterales bacterium]|nr:VCBS domain-containing protein [Vicinamibacterales bacterium]